MHADRIAIAETCLNGAHDGSLTFPEIVGTLTAAGFEGYLVDFRSNRQTFYGPDSESAAFDIHPIPGPIARAFDAAGVVSLVRWAQENPADYTYKAFCTRVKAAGCAGYIVFYPGRRVMYFGRTGETHVEHLPG